jgi:PAS domain S-box-containing protein
MTTETEDQGSSGVEQIADRKMLREQREANERLVLYAIRAHEEVDEAEAARATAEADRSRLFEHAGWGVAIINAPDSTLLAVNPAFARMHGYTVDELVGRPLKDLWAPESRDQLPEQIRRVHEKGHHLFEVTHMRKDGSRFPCLTDGTAVRDSMGRLTASAYNFQDITERKRAEEEQARARAALEWALTEQKKLEELRELLFAIVGHDLRAPISAIKMSAQMMLQRGLLAEADFTATARIVRNADRMARMTLQLLDFTRARLGGGIVVDLKPIDLANVCAEALAELEAAHPERELRFHSDGDTKGMWDPDRLAQVFSNLIGNAIQYGTPGSAIDVRLCDAGDEVRLTVRNDGPPIPVAMLPSIFDAFRRGNPRARAPGQTAPQSLGLGLFIAREVIRAHGGQVSVHSTEAEGTSFIVRLPRNPRAVVRGGVDER